MLFSNTFSIGFARRATTYKRANLLFHDLQRLLALHAQAGPIQIVYGGKAHPHDDGGKDLIRQIFAQIAQLRGKLSVVYLEDYDIAIEGCVEGVTGWSVGNGSDNAGTNGHGGDEQAFDAQSLYSKLETVILPLFYREQDRYIDVMRHAIALNGSFFNTERMVNQYVRKGYLR